ncbi:hypothetical protein QYE76_011550 [Lolium multiflorum]|uniref:Uncharacterized protein n=1 Tax=Lolium multiflorum TaxID=4521 RepID=A0AAD8TZ45_LOLMU|nr:hypothetical protein QYE76_011550 [Lolium multiflorum]
MENYSLLMGAAAVMKMEMAAVSMEKPSGALPRSGRCRNRDSCPPDLGFAMAAALDINLLKKLGISKKQDSLRFPKEESYPSPPMEYRVSFVDHLIRGLSSPIHDFLRGLLFVKPRYEKSSVAAVIAEAKIRGTESLRHLPEREVPPEGFSIDTAAISTAIFITAAAPMRRE